MTKYREILRLFSLGFSERNIALSCSVSRNNVSKVLKQAQEQQKEGSRRGLFLGEEMPLLFSLPATRFEPCDWKTATVQFNYHVAVDKMYYSVPFQYIKDKVDERVTDSTIEIFIHHNRIASHKRLYGRPGQYSTQTYGDRFRRWAETIGPNTYEVVNALLTSGRVEQQSYRGCMGLLKLAEKHSTQKLEAACKKALTYSKAPSYKSIKNLLAAMKDDPLTETRKEPAQSYGITRGARYYRWTGMLILQMWSNIICKIVVFGACLTIKN